MNKRIHAVALSAALLLPVGTVSANDWSKPQSRTKGTVIGAVAGALVAGKHNAAKGALIGAAVGNGVQAARHKHSHHKKHRHRRHS